MFWTCCLLGTYLNVIVRSFFPPSSNVILYSFILFIPSQKCFRHIFPNALRKSPQKPCSICSLIWCDRTAFWHMAPKRSSFQTPFLVWLCSSWPYQLSNLHWYDRLAVADGEIEQREPVVQHVFECSECHAFGKRVLKVFFWQHFIIAFLIFMISLYNFVAFLSSLHKPVKKLIFILFVNHPKSSRWLFSAMTFKPTNSAFVPFLIAEKNNPFPSFFRERVFLHETNGEAGREANWRPALNLALRSKKRPYDKLCCQFWPEKRDCRNKKILF